jgi:predicted transcriptional regulator
VREQGKLDDKERERSTGTAVHIEDTVDEMCGRFVDAWHRAERGELTRENAGRHVGFEAFETFSRIMTPKRLELLRLPQPHLWQARARRLHRLGPPSGKTSNLAAIDFGV